MAQNPVLMLMRKITNCQLGTKSKIKLSFAIDILYALYTFKVELAVQ